MEKRILKKVLRLLLVNKANHNLMKRGMILIAIILFTSSLFSQAIDLFFSEYVEGSSYNKALELFNGTGDTIDLSDYTIKKQTNGSGDFGNAFDLSGTLENNEVFIVCHNSASDEIQNIADATSSVCNFNGNDAVALFKNGDPVDIIGNIDSDEDWGKDVTMVRKDFIFGPTTNYSEEDWDLYDQDTFSYLGSHVFSGSADPLIIVSSPNGGEVWEQGTTHNITWSSLNFEGNVRISLEMVDEDRDREILIEDTENDGIWEWSIPIDQQIDDWYVIMIEGVNPDDPFDSSDNVFSIIEPIPVEELTIYEIQYSETGTSPYEGSLIRTTGVVTAAFYNSFYIQDGTGAWNGICVYPGSEEVTLGDEIQIKAIVEEYNGKTELSDYIIEQNMGQTPVPEPVNISTNDLASEEMYEGVLVKVNTVTITNPDMGYGEWEIDDTSGPCVVDDLGEYTYEPVQDDNIFSMTGVVDYSFEAYKLEPRTDDDLNFGGLVVSPLFLDFFTIDECINGQLLTIQNVSNDVITISEIPISGDLGGVTEWTIEDWIYELPYELAPNSELILNIVVGLPVSEASRDVVSDIMQIVTNVGIAEVAIYFQTDLISDYDENVIQASSKLIGNFPNPFNPLTTISFETIQSSENTEVAIYNMKGQKVKSLVDDIFEIGRHSIDWNGTDDKGNEVSSGIYYYKMKSGQYTATKKMLMLK